MYVRIFMKILFSTEGNGSAFASLGRQFAPAQYQKFPPTADALKPLTDFCGSGGAGPSRLTQSLSFVCVLRELTSATGWCWGRLACTSYLLQKRGNVCLCDFRWTVMNAWHVLLLTHKG